jgi:hypothetical protein
MAAIRIASVADAGLSRLSEGKRDSRAPERRGSTDALSISADASGATAAAEYAAGYVRLFLTQLPEQRRRQLPAPSRTTPVWSA